METTHQASDTNDEGVYIPKSYEFERDIDTEIKDTRKDVLEFDEDANEHFVYEDIDTLINTEDGKKDLEQMIDIFFNSQRERIKVLDNYTKGRNETILNGRRRLEKDKANYRIAHNYGGYVSTFITGFIMGIPLTIGSELHEADDKDNDVTDIKEIHADNDVDTLNYDLAYDTSRYGRGFELHYRDEDNKDVIALVEPFEMFVIRIANITKKIIAAVHCPIYNGKVHLSIYTDTDTITYDPFKPEAINLQNEDMKPHQYGMVPVVEWWNNRYRQGDFEPQISLIDAYDSAQSDTANYMSDLNDAMLVIEGDVNSTGLGVKDFRDMKDANMLILESGMSADGKERKLTAGYIYKQYDVEGTEAYKERLLSDYFKLCNVPNLDDENFQAKSGIALQYKLLGLRQIQTSKEGYFTKALRRRYKLIENIHKELNDVEIQANALTFTFHPNIPEDIWAEVEQFIKAGGDISQETLIELASFTDLVKEIKRLTDERDRNSIPESRFPIDKTKVDDADEEEQ